MKDTLTGNSFHAPGEYSVEISGWDADNSFFVERANLLWRADGEKQAHLLRELAQGSMIFIRSTSSDLLNLSVPVAYTVKTVMPQNAHGYLMNLVQMHARCKEPRESLTEELASNKQEVKRQCETNESGMALEQEEILL